VAPNGDRDPILEAYHLWNENGWEDCAAGCTAVTSLMRVHQVLTRRADQILAPIDLTFARYELLVRLYFSGGQSMPLSQLGRQLQIHQTSITSLVDKLEKQGLIRRTPHPTDRRSTIAQMTQAGRVLTGKAITLLNSELFRDLGLASGEANQLIGLLMKMRLSWGDIRNLEGWEPFDVGPGGGELATAVFPVARGEPYWCQPARSDNLY
jgi:DNA-binding MarR family transcriptional regulator